MKGGVFRKIDGKKNNKMADEKEMIVVHDERIVGKRRADTWSDEEIRSLLVVWAENLDFLRKAKRNSHVYEAMQKRLADEFGVKHRTKSEVKNKVTNLGRDYRRERAKLTSSGSSSSSWKYFSEVDQFLGNHEYSPLQETSCQVTAHYAVPSDSESNELLPLVMCDEGAVADDESPQLSDEKFQEPLNLVYDCGPSRGSPASTSSTVQALKHRYDNSTASERKRRRLADDMVDAVQQLCEKQAKYQETCAEIDSQIVKLMAENVKLQKESNESQNKFFEVLINYLIK